MSHDNDQSAPDSSPVDPDSLGFVEPQEDPEAAKSAEPEGQELPPVEAPSAAFLLQLFMIPMIIVAIVVTVMGNRGADFASYFRTLSFSEVFPPRRGNRSSSGGWRRNPSAPDSDWRR